MSLSLVKKSLELTASEYRGAEVKKVPKTSSNQQKFKKKISHNLLTDKKRAALREVQKIREQSLADEKLDKVALNVQRLLSLSNSTNRVHHHQKLEAKLIDKVGKKKEKKKKDEPQTSAFTEEDFNKFEKEYFANS